MSCVRCHGRDSGTTDLCGACEAQHYAEQARDEQRAPTPACFLAQFTVTPCEGRMDMAHLIPKSFLKREGIVHVWDPALYVPACRKHHGALDTARTLRVPREALPAALEAWAVRHGLDWFLDREYGPLEAAA